MSRKMAMKFASTLAAIAGLALSIAQAQSSPSVLFIGNSFLFGAGSPVRFYRSHSVTNLNSEGIGGVPALFKSFADQAGLNYDVYLETRGGSGFEFHLENKLGMIGQRPWDVVVMNGQSTLDLQKHGDPTKLVATARQLADVLHSRNPKVQIHLVATSSRASDHRPVARGSKTRAMARDVRLSNEKAEPARPPHRGHTGRRSLDAVRCRRCGQRIYTASKRAYEAFPRSGCEALQQGCLRQLAAEGKCPLSIGSGLHLFVQEVSNDQPSRFLPSRSR